MNVGWGVGGLRRPVFVLINMALRVNPSGFPPLPSCNTLFSQSVTQSRRAISRATVALVGKGQYLHSVMCTDNLLTPGFPGQSAPRERQLAPHRLNTGTVRDPGMYFGGETDLVNIHS